MTNLRAREALERARLLYEQRPSAAVRETSSATAIWNDGLQCRIVGSKGESAVTDMHPLMGGDGDGPNPGWLFRASLASCTATSIAMRAARLGITLKSLEVSVHAMSDARGLVGIEGFSTGLTSLQMSIRIGADDVAAEDLRALAETADAQSVVSSTLRASTPMALDITVLP